MADFGEIISADRAAKAAGKQTSEQKILEQMTAAYQKKDHPMTVADVIELDRGLKAQGYQVDDDTIVGLMTEVYRSGMSTSRKAEQAQKEYDAYIQSEEYAAGRRAANEEMLRQQRQYALQNPFTSIGETLPGAAHLRLAEDTKERELKAKLDYYNNLVEQEANQRVMDRDLAEFENWSEADQGMLKTYIIESDREKYDISGATVKGTARMKADPLFRKYGAQKVKEMAESYSRWENENNARDLDTLAREAVKGKVGASILHSAGTVAANIGGAVTAPAGYLGEMTGRTGRYTTMDPNNAGTMLNRYSAAVRDQVSSDIAGEAEGFDGRDALALVYQAGMSAVDNLARAALGGGNKAYTLGLAGASSFGQTMSEISELGGSPQQAVIMAVTNAGLEIATEYLPLDNLIKQAKGGAKNVTKILWNAFVKNGLTEVMEEEVNFLGSLLAEVAVLQEKSSYSRQVSELVAQGMSYQDAVDTANWDLVTEAVSIAATSWLSGAMSSGFTDTVTNVAQGLGAQKNAAANNGKTGAVKEPVQKIEGLKLGAAFETEGQSGHSGGVRIETTEQVAEETIQQAERLSRMVGRQVVLYSGAEAENGYYDRSTNTIHVNVRGADPVAQIVSHELTHSVEAAEVYGQLSRVVMDRIRQTGGDLQQMRRQKAARYEQAGHPLPDQNAVDKEIVAEYVSQYLLTDEQSIAELTRQDRSLSRRILNWLDGLLAKFGNTDAQERRFLYNARNLYAKALEQTQGSFDDRTAPDTAVQAGRETVSEGESQDLSDPQDLMEWARGAYNRGEMSEEEFDGIVEYVMQQEELEDSPRSIGGQNGEKQYSITEIQGEDENYGRGVALDTNLFDGVRPRAWGSILSDFVYKNLAGTELTMFTEQGAPETVVLVKANERVKKDGADKSRKAIDELARYRGDNIRALATVHLSEMLETSTHKENTTEHRHQWLDENGWEIRKTYITDRYGKIYQAELNIANARDGRRILYAINNIRHIDNRKKASPAAQVSSSENGGTRTTSRDAYEMSLPDDSDSVKQYSISSAAVDKKSVAGDLRAILNRGGNVAELRQYIDQLERGGSTEQTGRNSERKGVSAERNGAQRIIQAAKRNGISVEEYLRQNWEQYDVDGQWNEDARAALEMERRKGGRQYSVVDMDSHGHSLTPEQQEFYAQSQARNSSGRLLVLYHQTDGDFTIFDTRHPGAGSRDSDTPFGIFLKQTAGDIGLAGKKQMALYANITNPLRAANREDLARQLREISGSYASISDKHKQLDAQYHEKFEQAKKAWRDYIIEWRAANPGANRSALNDDPKFNELFDAEDAVVDEWTAAADLLSTQAKEAITEDLRKAGYDGVFLENDVGSWGRRTDAIIALDPQQVKNISNKMPTSNPDIRYSISETGTAEEQTREDTRTAEEIREELPAKARDRLAGTERKLLSTIQNKLGVTRFTDRPGLQNVIREISDEYLRTGTVADEKMGFLFDKAYAEGIVADSEFYDQYKDLKKHLAKTTVTLSQRDKADIADFDDFRRRAFGTLRIANEGGLPVDTAYGELHSMAPELFPERITHPSDQLQRMYEVGRSIQVSEKTLNEYHGREAAVFRKWAKNEFDNAVADVMADLKSVKRFADEKAATEETPKITTPEEAKDAYEQLKKARKTYEKAMAKSLLTAQDEMQVGRLLRGEILPEHLDPERDNVKDILAVYEAKREYEDITKQLGAYKREIRGKLREEADSYLETANDWKDKRMGLAYSRETMRRNVQDIVPDEELAKQINDTYFEPVHISEAEATRFKTAYRNQVRELKLSTKVQKGNLVSEAHAVQLLGEAEDNIRVLQNTRGRMKVRDGKTLSEWQAVVEELWKQSPGLDEGKIRNAVSKFREIYDDLFQKMNEVRIRNGYEPVNYRQGYFPHFQPGDGDGILAHFGKVMGIDTQVAALPTTINGLTHTFKPGIQWFGNAQERLGFNTAYDAVEGFDKYIEGVASVIYQTDNIQRLRALATQIRYRTSDEGIKKQVDAVNADTRLTDEEKQLKINDIYQHGKYTLSNFVNELDEYTNLLANKKSKLDRTMEAMMGRKAYTIMKAWESRVGANMIAGNISSALTNFIPLTQAGGQLDSGSLIKGMGETGKAYKRVISRSLDSDSLIKGVVAALKAIKEGDDIAEKSTFLTNRRGSDPLVKTWTQKTSEVLGTPMELIDCFTADSIVRAAYFQNLKRGLSEAEAMNQADVFASGVMADRSKGAMPTLFASTNPLVKMFTQFQLEVNNQYSEIFKDLPRNLRKKGLAVLFGTLLKYFLGAFLYNEVYEFFVGRRAALDPFDILNDTVGDLTGYELPNLVEFTTGKDRSFETEKVGIGEAGKNLMSTALGELPFSSGLTLFGVETDGGRIPASSAVPDLAALWDAATEEGWSTEKRWKEAQDELNKLAYVIPPFGGNQVQKIWKGVSAYIEGGSYNVDKEGKDILQYPVFNDEPQDFWSLVRASILGKSSLPEAQDWVDSGFKSLSAKQTAVYQDMAEAGVEQREAYDLIRKIQSADGADAKRGALDHSGIAEEGKAIAFYGLVATESERELMDLLTDAGAGEGAAYRAVMAMKETDGLKGGTKKDAERRALAKSGLTEEEKMILVGDILGTEMTTDSGKPTAYANFLTARSTGLSIDGFMELRSAGADMEDYLVFTDAGIGADDAKTLALELCRLKPEAGEEKVSSQQRCRVIVDSDLTEHQQIAALSTVMSKSELAKVETGCTFDLTPKAYVGLKDILPKYDANGNGSYTQAEVEDAIDALSKGNENVLLALVGEKDTGLHLTRKQMAALWQIQNKSWKAAKNPYDREVGQQVYDAMHSED